MEGQMEKSTKRVIKAARRLVSLRDLRTITGELEDRAEKTLGLADVELVDHCDGTNLDEWLCCRCQAEWLARIRLPCRSCNPQAYQAMIEALNSAEKRPVSGLRFRLVVAIKAIMIALEIGQIHDPNQGRVRGKT